MTDEVRINLTEEQRKVAVQIMQRFPDNPKAGWKLFFEKYPEIKEALKKGLAEP